MSGSAIGDALKGVLSAPSLFGNNVSTCSYHVLETAQYLSAVISWTGFTSRKTSFGGRERDWDMRIACYSRNTGDGPAVVKRVWDYAERVLSSLEAIDELPISGSGTATIAHLHDISGTHDPELEMQVNGVGWRPFIIRVTATEYEPEEF